MTPTKGELTRERIISTAAPLFNRLGYAGASIADLLTAAGLEKGGLYRHFESKEAIAVAAFDHAAQLHGKRIRSYLAAAPTDAASQLTALAEAIASIAVNPVVVGGCPLLNTAIESDDAEGTLYTELRARARRGMTRLLGTAKRIVSDGIETGELRSSADPDEEASFVVATMEGALMLAKLYDDPQHMRHAVTRVKERAYSLRRRSK